MNRFEERLEHDMNHIADRATPSPTAWEAIQTRIVEQANQPEMEITMLDTAPPPPRRTGAWIIGAAAALVLIIGVFALTRSNDEPPAVFAGDPEPAPTVEQITTPEPSLEPAAADAAGDDAPADVLSEGEQIALDFIAARASFDGEAARALVADDASIAAFAEWADVPDDYLALDDFERASNQRFLDPICEDGSPGRVRCTYSMESDLTVALGVGPYSNSFLFDIADGQIQQVTHNRTGITGEPGEFFADVYALAFRPWIQQNYADDFELMFNVTGNNNDQAPLITQESAALWEQRVPEYIASLNEEADGAAG